MVFRASSALLGLATLGFGIVTGLACSTNTHVAAETYLDEAAEDYGCIVGDLGCECLAGDVCDGGLTCVDDICRCVEGPCKEMPPVTTDTESDSGTETATDTATDSGTDSTDSGSTTDTDTDTDTTESTTETTTETDTETDTSTDSGTDTSTT